MSRLGHTGKLKEWTGSPRRHARWTVTNEFHHEGFCYRIVRRPLASEGEVHLTEREQQALVHAQRGLSNKQIARSLGVAASTVGVLLFRASAKFRVKTRAELLAAYAAQGPAPPRR
jgi:DNA-binding CsgD family transcriptional regulator